MTLLATEGLGRRFGGLAAVDDVTLAIEPGEIRAVIGPNGAGKTTLVGMIAGRIPPSAGRIHYAGEDVTWMRPWERVRRGIVYTFQITSVFGNLSCHNNVALAAQRSESWARGDWWPRTCESTAEAVANALDRVGLATQRDIQAGALPYGHQRLLELAMALALRPRLLVLDEPTQGLAEDEVVAFCSLVRDIAREATVLMIEHNMAVVMTLADRITVMHNGRLLAEGTAAEIQADHRVREAYLGA